MDILMFALITGLVASMFGLLKIFEYKEKS